MQIRRIRVFRVLGVPDAESLFQQHDLFFERRDLRFHLCV